MTKPYRIRNVLLGVVILLCAAWVAVQGTVDQAKARIEAAMQMPSWQAPGEAIDMTSLQGKRVWVLTSTLSVPFVSNIAKGVTEAADAVGWKTTLVDGQGDVNKWNASLEQAVAQKVDAIISIAASPELMTTAMKKALDANIPVIDVLTADKDADLVPGTFAHVSISFYESGRLQADYAIMDSGGKANVLIFGDNEFPGEVTRVQGMRDEFAALCPDCKVTFQDTQVAKLATDLGSLTQTLLRRDPSINYVLPTYDAQAVYIVPAIKQAGLASRVNVVSSDAVASNLDWTAKQDVQVADVGEPDVWTGWAAVDEIARAMLGLPSVDSNVPLRMFTASNLQGVDTQDEDALFGGDFRSQYKALWGLQ